MRAPAARGGLVLRAGPRGGARADRRPEPARSRQESSAQRLRNRAECALRPRGAALHSGRPEMPRGGHLATAACGRQEVIHEHSGRRNSKTAQLGAKMPLLSIGCNQGERGPAGPRSSSRAARRCAKASEQARAGGVRKRSAAGSFVCERASGDAQKPLSRPERAAGGPKLRAACAGRCAKGSRAGCSGLRWGSRVEQGGAAMRKTSEQARAGSGGCAQKVSSWMQRAPLGISSSSRAARRCAKASEQARAGSGGEFGDVRNRIATELKCEFEARGQRLCSGQTGGGEGRTPS